MIRWPGRPDNDDSPRGFRTGDSVPRRHPEVLRPPPAATVPRARATRARRPHPSTEEPWRKRRDSPSGRASPRRRPPPVSRYPTVSTCARSSPRRPYSPIRWRSTPGSNGYRSTSPSGSRVGILVRRRRGRVRCCPETSTVVRLGRAGRPLRRRPPRGPRRAPPVRPRSDPPGTSRMWRVPSRNRHPPPTLGPQRRVFRPRSRTCRRQGMPGTRSRNVRRHRPPPPRRRGRTRIRPARPNAPR